MILKILSTDIAALVSLELVEVLQHIILLKDLLTEQKIVLLIHHRLGCFRRNNAVQLELSLRHDLLVYSAALSNHGTEILLCRPP